MLPTIALALFFVRSAFSQSRSASDSVLDHATLKNCIHFALTHQPAIRQSVLDEAVAERVIGTKLADWYPQINFTFNVQHNAELPTSIFQDNPIKIGLLNTSSGQFSISQNIFNKDVLLASSSASDVRLRASQQTIAMRIDAVVDVSKAFYAVLVTRQQIELLDEDILRLRQNFDDALNQYKSGVVDKTDYERATIALNNARAAKSQTEELLKARYAALKDQMGYPSKQSLRLEYDTTRMEQDAMMDTTQTVHPAKRIEFQLLQTLKRLQEANVDYYKWNFLPSLSAFGNYNLNYQNNALSRLYGMDYPNSYFGIQLSFPIFQGGKRIDEIAQAKLELERADYDIVAVTNFIDAEYSTALANYQSSLNNYIVLKKNVELAKDVYRTIQLQYKAGTKTYLDAITAETDLRTAQANESDALYQLLSSKLDMEKALGAVGYQYTTE